MNQQETTANSLAATERFQQYCIAPSDANIKYWNNWLLENPEQEIVFAEAKKIVQQLSFQPNETEVEIELARFKNQIKTNQSNVHELNGRRVFLRIAATLLLLLTSLFIWKKYADTPIELKQLTTDYGETKRLELSDGSMVLMNANSDIQFQENWEGGFAREVWLKGEAHFDVAKQDGQSFIVHTDKGDIRVLGTSFNVSQRKEQLEVTLLEGKVQLQLANDTKVNLKPNEQVRFVNNTVDVTQADVDAVTAWQHNRMVFKNATIASVIERLENDFGWQLEVTNQKLLERKINAQIPKNDPKLLLEALTALYDLSIEQNADGAYVID